MEIPKEDSNTPMKLLPDQSHFQGAGKEGAWPLEVSRKRKYYKNAGWL